ncbi:transglycosylase SLT domain-containing protein [Bauldia sp.]|uniref:lytic transglycosylase domain-containing protein n=1 Tax=Bauldia sp. TaxID=2575872 RepID=UPI003BAB861E
MTTSDRKPAMRSIAVSVATLAVPAMVLSGFSVPSLRAEDGTIVVADIPMPRLNPQRVHSDASPDLIGRFIAQSDDIHRDAIEDSDGPVGEYTPTEEKPTTVASVADMDTVGLRYAVKFLDEGNFAAATAAAYAMPNPVDTKVIDWLVAISGEAGVPASHVAQNWRKLADWPGQRLLQIRFEEALVREKPSANAVIEALADRKPETASGAILLAQSYLDAGRKSEAAAVIRDYWREKRFGSDVEAKLRKAFGSLLTSAEYKARTERLLYEEQNSAALRNARFLGKDEQALAAAVVAVSNRKNMANALGAVPAAKRKDPLYIYARVQYLRRADKMDDAAELLLSAPSDPAILDGDAWWVERRIISRALLDEGDARTAYRIAAGHAAEGRAPVAEAEFHAGWYALEYLNDPNTAKKHFAAIHQVSTRPLSQSRADYWLGRAAEKAGNRAEANQAYQRAGRHPTTFYGQLALARLGVERLPIAAVPKASGTVKARFESRELVQVIHRLDSINRGDRNDIFYRALADQLTDPAEIALLAAMAEEHGGHQFALQIGKLAAYRGLAVDTTAFPTSAIPTSAKTGRVEKPMVYAIARQESAFNPGAVSSAGARGLLQLMPRTAQSMAKAAGLPYSKTRLTSDPAYNATLGATFLGRLYRDYEGSFVMTFAAYNAGPSRVKAWVAKYGDPRDPNVDTVNWVERIPFTETRNYVQRIMENLQVYRARLGSPALTIETDLKRGRV